MLKLDSVEGTGLDEHRWQHALSLAEHWCQTGQVPALALLVGRHGHTPGVIGWGNQTLAGDSPPLREDALFLVASLTKPIVAMAVLLLVERGQITLGDRVADYVPGFAIQGKNGIRIRHLLTHTSGLPDMLPENERLRSEQRPLEAFVERTAIADMSFTAGRGVQYQSMGFGVLGAVIETVSGRRCADFLQQEIFEPLGMDNSHLGLPDSWFEPPETSVERIAEIRIPDAQVGTNWGWNTRYWRQLGAPWGGLITTPWDLGLFAQLMLRRGLGQHQRIFSTATVSAATRNQLTGMSDLDERDRVSRPWGFGWRLNWPGHSANFGDLLGPNSYGHWGATGTLMWMDPERDAFLILLTTQPQEPHGYFLSRLSNAIAAALH